MIEEIITYQQYLLAFIVFWLAHVVRQFLVYLRLWQIKQYRWDRLKNDFLEDWKIFIPRASITSSIVWISFFVFPRNIFLLLASINFLTWGGYSLIQLMRKKWHYPQATKKMKVLFSFFVFGFAIFSYFGFYYFPNYLPIIVLTIIVFFPVVAFSYLGLAEWPASFLKSRIVRKATLHRERLRGLEVVGITGSFGKTSVKDFLYHFLVFKYGVDKVLKTNQNNNTEMGIAQTILATLTKKHRFFVCEMGAYVGGEIKKSSNLAKPKMGILTGINNQHQSLFGSQENIISAKYELMEGLPDDGLGIFNGDNEMVADLYEKHSREKILVSTDRAEQASWRAIDIIVSKKSVSFKMASRDKVIPIKASLVGSQNVINILLAGAAALRLGLSPEELAKATKNLPTPSGSPDIFKYHQADVISAVYSSNPDAAKAHLGHLRLWSGRKVLVTPGFIELGESSKEAHYSLGVSLGHVCDLAIVTKSNYFQSIKDGLDSVNGKTELILIESPEEIIRRMQEFRGVGDVILFEGRASSKIIDFLKST
jgi:UDP-N-acetylmuramoyl-tripeptide--D-alanyl-D-alanine ligase